MKAPVLAFGGGWGGVAHLYHRPMREKVAEGRVRGIKKVVGATLALCAAHPFT